MSFKKKYLILPVLVLSFFVFVGFSKQDFNISRNLELMFNVVKSVNLYYVDTIDNDKMAKRGIDAMLSALDPYTEYISKEEMNNFKTMTTGKYGGLGSAIRKPFGSKYIVLDEITEGFPIYKSGLMPGDSIIAVDSVDMTDASAEKVSSAMKGTPETEVVLTVKSIKDGQKRDYKLKREQISVSPIGYAGMYNEEIGIIVFTDFTEGSGERFRAEVEKLKANNNLKGLVIDLRGNGGGIIDESITLLSSFVPKNTHITSLKGRGNVSHKDYYTHQEPIDTLLPLAVIINRQSASASEIVAGSLQDLDRAVIIGEKSLGKGLAQRPQDIGYGAMVKITIAKYYIPSGRCIQAIDYSHRNADGTVNKVADSLRNKFQTKNGRTVYDGGGIEPDIKSKQEYINLFCASAIARGYLADYANAYRVKYPTIGSVRDFEISDSDYAEFAKTLNGKIIEFTSVTENNFDKLLESAKKEEYYSKIEKELESIKTILKERNTAKSLQENKTVMKELLAMEIISRYQYSRGRIEYSLVKDNIPEQAVKIVSDIEKYKNILKK